MSANIPRTFRFGGGPAAVRDHSEISDEGLAALSGMTALQEISIDAPNVTDKGLEHLKRLKGLRRLYVGRSKITKEGRQELVSAIPGLKFTP